MYTYCANNPIYYSDSTGHIAVVDDIVIAAAILVAGVVTTALSQPEVQEGLSTMINKASYAVEEFAENAASVIASAAISVASAVSEVTGISSAPVLAPPTGLKKKYSTLVDSNYNPYLAPWLYASMGSQSIAKDDAIEKDITFPWPIIPKTYYHYTNEANAMAILESGKILPDERGRVFLTPYLYSSDEVNNSLYMGRKSSDYGEYRITVQFFSLNDPCLSKVGATQWNEIIYYGTIRNGRNAILTVMKNE